MDENGIMDLIISEYSWEQVINRIISLEGLDPWDLDLKVLSSAFLRYIIKRKELDFKIPAKYIIIASVLLEMKSKHLYFLDMLSESEMVEGFDDGLVEAEEEQETGENKIFEVNPINIPPKRIPNRRVMVDELIIALRRVLKMQEKKKIRDIKARGAVKIGQDDVSNRIQNLYKKISDLLAKIEEKEIKFSALIGKWQRKEVVDTFLPLVYLDHNKKVNCRQEKMFEEIYIKKE